MKRRLDRSGRLDGRGRKRREKVKLEGRRAARRDMGGTDKRGGVGGRKLAKRDSVD